MEQDGLFKYESRLLKQWKYVERKKILNTIGLHLFEHPTGGDESVRMTVQIIESYWFPSLRNFFFE